MPEFTVIHIALLALSVAFGLVLGWVIRAKRSAQEKAAVNAGWNERVAAQESEHHRLVIQNTGLMDQIREFQSSNRDAKKRAKELSVAAKEANDRRDVLQREIKDIRSNLEIAVTQRDRLQSDIATRSESDIATQEKDEKIFQLSRELENWHSRLPPLIERYRIRNEEAEQLEADLAAANLRIEQLENEQDNPTRIEPVRDPETLTDGHDASNDSVGSQIVSELGSMNNTDDDEHATPGDDLKQIKGVGPAIEKTLNDMGIFRFQQIANMSEYDIDRVAQRLRGFHSRIYREDWIGQARELNDHSSSD